MKLSRVTPSSFASSRLSAVDFGGGLLRDVRFDDCVLRMSLMRMCELERVDFRECRLDDVDGYEARLDGVAFGGTSLVDVDLDKARFHAVDLRGATELDLRHVRDLSGCLLQPEQVTQLAFLFAAAAGVAMEKPQEEP